MIASYFHLFLLICYVYEVHCSDLPLEHVLPNLFIQRPPTECLVLVSPPAPTIKLHESYQILHLDMNNNNSISRISKNKESDNKRLRTMVPKAAKCVVSVTTKLADFELIQQVTVAVDNHINVYLSEESPTEHMLLMINRPLLWVHQGISKYMHVFEVFCAKMGKPKVPKPVLAGTCRPSCCDVSCFPKKVEEICSNPMRGQTITLSEPITFPNYLPPQMFNTGGKMSGSLVNMFVYASSYFGFNPKIDANVVSGDFIPSNLTYTPGKYLKVQTGGAEVTQAGLSEVFHLVFDIVAPYYSVNVIYITRSPLPITSLENITREFSASVWAMTLVTTAALSLMLYVTYLTYNRSHMKVYKLARVEKLRTNFLIFPFAKITEPDPLPWFKKWSTGKFLVLLWSILSLFLTHFYTSNFRASLVIVTYEDPPTRLADILERGETVYNFKLAVDLRKEYLEAIGQSGSVKHRIAILSEETGGLYSFVDTSGGLPPEAPDDLLRNGAFVLMEDVTIPYLSVIYPGLVREAIYVVDEAAISFYKCMVVQKYSPGTKALSKNTRRSNEFGLPLKWFTEHLSMRSLLKRPMEGNRKPLDLESYYTLGLAYSIMILVACISFLSEKLRSANPKIDTNIPMIWMVK